MNLIACVSQYKWAIGCGDDLLFHIPEDLKRFRKITYDKVVIMGRKTYDSLPKKPLDGRINIVISRTLPKSIETDNLYIVRDIEEAVSRSRYFDHTKRLINSFVIGGESVYRRMLGLCDKAYITKVTGEDLVSELDEDKTADKFLDNLYNNSEWGYSFSLDRETYEVYKQYRYTYVEFERICNFSHY